MESNCTQLNVTSSQEPILFKNSLDWKIVKWSAADWKNLLSAEPDAKYSFRRGPFICSQTPIWERECAYESLTMDQFFNRFTSLNDHEEDWLYFDYKHISSNLSDAICSKLDFSWEVVGYPEKSAKDSTIWIGTQGAHTPCHVDTYGCNFVAQVFGKKRWLLFPPSDTLYMHPVRVPYEESSIYSSFNFFRGCAQYPDVKDAIMVNLEPGDILYVPKGWWHYVENITPAISVNVWIPKESDKESRISECLVKFLVHSVLEDMDSTEARELLNPNEDDLSTASKDRILKELNWCVDQMNSSSVSSFSPSSQYKERDHVLPRSSIETIKAAQYSSHKCTIDNSQSAVKSLRFDLINSLCHPDVIELATKKLLESSVNKVL